ncbi:minor capsid protein [Eggerthellaceae bacterium 24-137]
MSIEVDISGIEGFLSGRGIERAQELLANQVKDAAEEFVPIDTQALRDSAVASGDVVDYTVDYAGYVYDLPEDGGIRPGTGGRWGERVAAEKADELCEWLAGIIEGEM